MKHENWPKVSVVISTYDRVEQLGRALESVHAQTFDDFEVVVVDDCTPDVKAMESLLKKWYGRFQERGIELWAHRLETNSGYQCFPKNRGIEHSSGDYIAYLDDDNTWRPDHLQTCVDTIESDMSTDMVYTRMCYVVSDDETRKVLTEAMGRVPEGDSLGIEWNPSTLPDRNIVDTNTMMHSKGAFWRMVRESGYGWDEKLRRFGDWNFVWRWSVYGQTAKLIDKVTVDYYWHMGGLQITRPAMEVPVCFNYAQYLATRKNQNLSSPSVS
jgi:glycosyltransferase involved in cell wall biosynthesis